MRTTIEHCRYFDASSMQTKHDCPCGFKDVYSIGWDDKATVISKCIFGDCEYYED